MTDEPGLPTQLERTLVDRLLSERFAPAVGHLVLLAIVIALAWGSVPTPVLAAWATAVVAITLVRLILWQRARTLAPAAARTIARSTLLALGLAWGLGTAIAAQYLPLVTVVLVVVGLAGLLAGAVATQVADRWAFKLYMSAMLGPALVGILLVRHSRYEETMIPLMLVFAAFMWSAHGHAYQTLVDGLRAVENQEILLHELQTALAEVRTLRGLIKICAECKRVLTDEGSWEQFESYVRGHTDVEFSHGICPDCARKVWSATSE